MDLMDNRFFFLPVGVQTRGAHTRFLLSCFRRPLSRVSEGKNVLNKYHHEDTHYRTIIRLYIIYNSHLLFGRGIHLVITTINSAGPIHFGAGAKLC